MRSAFETSRVLLCKRNGTPAAACGVRQLDGAFALRGPGGGAAPLRSRKRRPVAAVQTLARGGEPCQPHRARRLHTRFGLSLAPALEGGGIRVDTKVHRLKGSPANT